MEQFDIPHQRIKEKSVYQLNLDAPRIILISAAVIGIVIVSFLLGMNFIKGSDGAKTLMTKNDIFDSQKELDLLKTNIPGPGAADEDELSKPLDEKLTAPDGEENGIGTKSDRYAAGDESHGTDGLSAEAANESSSTLTIDNVSESAAVKKHAVKKSSRPAARAEKVSRSEDLDPPLRYVKKATGKGESKKKRNARSKVVAVSGDRADYRRVNTAGGFMIQVASLDSKNRAMSEVRSLREMKYDAFMDDTQVNGKKFYRVRVGPVASKQKALDLLKDFQGKDRYRESYMVAE